MKKNFYESTIREVEKPWGEQKGQKIIGEYVLFDDNSQFINQQQSTIDHKEICPQTMPFSIKIIKTGKPLSIQNHPDTEWALKHNLPYGKYESWIVLDCKNQAKVLAGLKKDLPKDIKLNDSLIQEYFNFIPVNKFDLIDVTPGIVHSIGANITIIEIQNNVIQTLRLYDYDSDRELQVERFFECLKPELQIQPKKLQANNIFPGANYKLKLFEVNGTLEINTSNKFYVCVMLEGAGTINNENLKPLVAYFVPDGTQTLNAQGNMKILFVEPNQV